MKNMGAFIVIFFILLICSCSGVKEDIVSVDETHHVEVTPKNEQDSDNGVGDVGNAESPKSDKETTDEIFAEILTAISSKDDNKMKGIFSEKIVNEVRNIAELFAYFDGKVENYTGIFPYTEESFSEGSRFQAVESSYDVTTVEGMYRVAFRYVLQDDTNKDNVGLHSLYIIKVVDADEYVYWGDGSFSPGIHIGVPNWSS